MTLTTPTNWYDTTIATTVDPTWNASCEAVDI